MLKNVILAVNQDIYNVFAQMLTNHLIIIKEESIIQNQDQIQVEIYQDLYQEVDLDLYQVEIQEHL